jgi:hypothetical protein
VNQRANVIWKITKEVFYVCEKRFFTDETLKFPKPLLGSGTRRWSIATVFAGNKELSWYNYPDYNFMNPSFLKRGWGVFLQLLMQYVCYLEEGKPSMKPLDKILENLYSIKEAKAGIAFYSLRTALKSHFATY